MSDELSAHYFENTYHCVLKRFSMYETKAHRPQLAMLIKSGLHSVLENGSYSEYHCYSVQVHKGSWKNIDSLYLKWNL